MTVSKFFGIMFKLILYPFTLYWWVVYYFFNEKNQTWQEHWDVSIAFICSFVCFVILMIILFVCFIAYCIYNANRAFTIVFSPKYMFDNFWKDVAKAFD